MLAFLIIYCKWQAAKQNDHLYGNLKFVPDRESFTGLFEYLNISLPSTIMICAKIWGGQVLIFIAGYMSVTD